MDNGQLDTWTTGMLRRLRSWTFSGVLLSIFRICLGNRMTWNVIRKELLSFPFQCFYYRQKTNDTQSKQSIKQIIDNYNHQGRSDTSTTRIVGIAKTPINSADDPYIQYPEKDEIRESDKRKQQDRAG